MPHRLLRGFGRKGSPEPEPASPTSPSNAARPAAAPVAPAVATSQTLTALELARELFRGVEHFILSTPDLDTPSFLNRLRRMSAQLTGSASPDDLEAQRQWVAESLAAFGQLQRRYLAEREDELWRVLGIYGEHQRMDGAANQQFHEGLRGAHERMGNLMRLDDLRQVRERLESELQRVDALVDQKAKSDLERASLLDAKVRQLEAALSSARQEAMQDPLTGVYHRGGFLTQLEALLASPTPLALAMIDIDNFKDINDTLGHLVGDQVLRFAVELLGKVARPGDVIGRYGGDEFCLAAPGIPADRLGDRFDALASQRTINFQLEERFCSVRLSFSVGVASSAAGDTIESLMERADGAMYEAKRSGKGQARVARTPVSAA
ncbi:MAG: GGDEF domain-containing protein [Armatimonadota bacterium]